MIRSDDVRERLFMSNNVVMFVSEELHFVFKYELGNQAQDVIENRMD